MPEYLAPGVYVEETSIRARTIEGVPTGAAAFLGETQRGPTNPTRVTSLAEYETRFGGVGLMAQAARGFFENGGQHCLVARVVGEDGNDGAGVGVDDYAARLAQIDDVQVFYAPNALQTPGLAELLLRDVEARRNGFCLLDALEGDDASSPELRQRYGLESKFGALYMPWLETSTGQFVPPGGHVAGIYARVDAQRGVWKAPANEIVNGVVGLRIDVNNSQQALLIPVGVNAIRSFPGRGIRVWGARTLSSDAEWRYVGVRRLFNFIEASIERGTQWAVFEPNGESLWARVRSIIEAFLVSVWRDGALQGATPESAFFVQCDRSTMTQDDIDNGRLIAEIGIAAVKPAEFVNFRISLKTVEAP